MYKALFMRKIALTLSFARKTAAAAGATRDGGGSGTSGEKASGGVAGTGGLSDHSDDIDDAKSLTSGGLSGEKVGGGLGGTDNDLYHSKDHGEYMGKGTAPITGLPSQFVCERGGRRSCRWGKRLVFVGEYSKERFAVEKWESRDKRNRRLGKPVQLREKAQQLIQLRPLAMPPNATPGALK